MAGEQTEGGLWRPANGAEAESFSRNWCAHCQHRDGDGDWEDEFGNDVEGGCHICNMSLWGQQPHQLKIRDGQPHCAAFREDLDNPARCLKTMEMAI